MEAEMSRRKRHGKVEVEGLFGYAEDDPIAEVMIMTEYGQELPIDPDGPMSNPFQWIDSVVRVWGRFVMRDGQRYLLVDRIHHVDGDPLCGEVADDPYDLDIGPYWDDGESEHEDRY
jgi:hypothetical protein